MDKISLPIQRLDGALLASDANRDERVVPMTFYSGATVLQFSRERGVYNLKLSMEPGHVRLRTLRSGMAPFTLGHRSANDPEAVIGVVTDGRLENGKAKADVRFSKRPDVEPVYNDVLDGILRNVSVEATLHKLKEVGEEGDKIKTFLATDWEPTAIALVAQGADPNAHINAAQEVRLSECEVEFAVRATSPKEQAMEKTIEKTGEQARTEVEQPAQVQLADEQLNAAHKVGVTAEQGRITGILRVAKVCGLDLAFAEKHISANTTLETFRTIAIDEQAARAARQELRTAHTDILSDEADVRRRKMTAALLERFSPGMWGFDERENAIRFHKEGGQRFYDGGREFASCTLLDIAKECLAAQKIRWQSKNRTEIAQLAFQSTSDFPYILADVAGKSLRAGYEAVESQWRLIAARRTAADFKSQKELTLDANSRLEKVPESGEFKRGKLVEGRETYTLSTYGKIISITRQAIINDDLGAFTRTPQLLGQEVAMLEADTVWGIVTTNGNLADGVAIFAAAATRGATVAGNLVTGPGTVINATNLTTMRVMMMRQESTGEKTLGVQPRYLVAPATQSMLAEQYTSTGFVAATPANINPMAGKLTPIIEPRLDATSTLSWYLFADPNTPNGVVLIYAYLEGQEGPYTETRNGFDVDGTEIKIRHDFAAAAVDFRGAVKNDGA